jgi:hypothetical protein
MCAAEMRRAADAHPATAAEMRRAADAHPATAAEMRRAADAHPAAAEMRRAADAHPAAAAKMRRSASAAATSSRACASAVRYDACKNGCQCDDAESVGLWHATLGRPPRVLSDIPS